MRRTLAGEASGFAGLRFCKQTCCDQINHYRHYLRAASDLIEATARRFSLKKYFASAPRREQKNTRSYFR